MMAKYQSQQALEGFDFWTKTSTQADNAIEGPTKYKLFITAFKDEDRQRDPRKTEGPWGGEFLCYFWEDKGPGGGEFLCNFGHR